MGKILPISLKLNFTPNTLGFYGLSMAIDRSILKTDQIMKAKSSSILHLKLFFFSRKFSQC